MPCRPEVDGQSPSDTAMPWKHDVDEASTARNRPASIELTVAPRQTVAERGTYPRLVRPTRTTHSASD